MAHLACNRMNRQRTSTVSPWPLLILLALYVLSCTVYTYIFLTDLIAKSCTMKWNHCSSEWNEIVFDGVSFCLVSNNVSMKALFHLITVVQRQHLNHEIYLSSPQCVCCLQHPAQTVKTRRVIGGWKGQVLHPCSLHHTSCVFCSEMLLQLFMKENAETRPITTSVENLSAGFFSPLKVTAVSSHLWSQQSIYTSWWMADFMLIWLCSAQACSGALRG